MKAKWVLAVCLGVGLSAAAWAAGEPPVEIETGDTLWDVSGQIWEKPAEWPKLWAQNPHVHNPHRVWPGDQLFLRATEAPPETIVHEVVLPVERLTPPPPPAPEPAPEAAPAQTAKAAPPPPPEPEPLKLKVIEARAQDYVVPAPVKRLGTVEARAVKNGYVENEEVMVHLAAASAPAPGTKLTVFDDSRILYHPVTGAPYGYHVRVLGHVQVIEAKNGVARAKIIRSYDDISRGNGVMAFRKPVVAVVPKLLKKSLDGVVVGGGRSIQLFATDEAVFLDRGKADGLEPGVLLEAPYPAPPPRAAEGMVVETGKPTARLVVVGVEERSSTLYFFDNRIAVKAGTKVRTQPVSP